MPPIPDKNIFMMCPRLNLQAIAPLPTGYSLRCCQRNELELWLAMPYDTHEEYLKHKSYMQQFYNNVYRPQEHLFYQNCLFVCNQQNQPIATCMAWPAYGGQITTLHWFKVKKPYEGQGIGRALLAAVMQNILAGQYPVFLHTQPASYRAIALYSSFGFYLLQGGPVGKRNNQLAECLPILQQYMTKRAYSGLKICPVPPLLLKATQKEKHVEF